MRFGGHYHFDEVKAKILKKEKKNESHQKKKSSSFQSHSTCSDGIHDNLLPCHYGLAPKDIEPKFSTISDWEHIPIRERNEFGCRWRLNNMQHLITSLKSITPASISNMLMETAKKNSEPARNWLQNSANKGKLPKNVPGKLDHATVVCVQLS